MNSHRFLIDNNALGTLGSERRGSGFFRKCCMLPEEVLYEARSRRDHVALQHLRYAVTPSVLTHLQIVMSAVPVSDVSLVDLYKNLGAADPLIVASALDGIANEDSLLPDTWVIVTHDKALLAMASEFKIQTMSPEMLANLIDAGTSASGVGLLSRGA